MEKKNLSYEKEEQPKNYPTAEKTTYDSIVAIMGTYRANDGLMCWVTPRRLRPLFR